MNKIIQTADGSNTLYNETIGEHYHSKHGALQESLHVFIEAGLKEAIEKGKNRSENDQAEPEDAKDQGVTILEVGFGTGLNFLLSLAYCEEHHIKLNYTGIEAFPISKDELLLTAYGQYITAAVWENFINTYENAIGNTVKVLEEQQLQITHTTLASFETQQQFDLIYYDAFSVQHQPEMWTEDIIAKTCSFLKSGGIFVTYAITGNLKRALKKAGMTIEKLPGAPGKREMLRATKV